MYVQIQKTMLDQNIQMFKLSNQWWSVQCTPPSSEHLYDYLLELTLQLGISSIHPIDLSIKNIKNFINNKHQNKVQNSENKYM